MESWLAVLQVMESWLAVLQVMESWLAVHQVMESWLAVLQVMSEDNEPVDGVEHDEEDGKANLASQRKLNKKVLFITWIKFLF